MDNLQKKVVGMTQSTNKGVTAIKILDDGTAQVLQVDSVGGFMVNTKKGGEIIKFNLCQDLPIMEDPTRTGFSYVQKK